MQNKEFVADNLEAQRAVKIFGKDRKVGTAKIGLDVINSKEWQEKRKKKVEEFEKNGITLSRDEENK